MRIVSVTAADFGPLRSSTLGLAPGLTVVVGGNESGKSSWHAALYAALCGRRRSRGRGADVFHTGRDRRLGGIRQVLPHDRMAEHEAAAIGSGAQRLGDEAGGVSLHQPRWKFGGDGERGVEPRQPQRLVGPDIGAQTQPRPRIADIDRRDVAAGA